jgi:hypothetical protein
VALDRGPAEIIAVEPHLDAGQGGADRDKAGVGNRLGNEQQDESDGSHGDTISQPGCKSTRSAHDRMMEPVSNCDRFPEACEMAFASLK